VMQFVIGGGVRLGSPAARRGVLVAATDCGDQRKETFLKSFFIRVLIFWGFAFTQGGRTEDCFAKPTRGLRIRDEAGLRTSHVSMNEITFASSNRHAAKTLWPTVFAIFELWTIPERVALRA